MEKLLVPVVHGAALDRPDEADTVVTAEAVAAGLQRLGFATKIVALTAGLGVLENLAAARPFIVFNLVEALDGEAAKAPLAMARLEALGIAYTGVHAAAYAQSNSKLDTKRALARHRIPTPAFWRVDDDVPGNVTVIVKSIDEHGSLGMDQGSIVKGVEAKAEIARRERQFGGFFFAEEYIEGREFNVSVIETREGAQVLPIAEIDFTGLPSGQHAIVDFAAKWEPDAPAYHLTPRRFGLDVAEPSLAAQIRRLTLACWRAFDLTGYARVDFRVGADGVPYVLEVNANPCLAPDAGFAAAAAEAGFTYDALIAAIVDVGAHTQRMVA